MATWARPRAWHGTGAQKAQDGPAGASPLILITWAALLLMSPDFFGALSRL